MKKIAKIILTSVLSLSAVNANAGAVIGIAGAAGSNAGLAKFGAGVFLAGGTLYFTAGEDWGAKAVGVMFMILDAESAAKQVNSEITAADLEITPEQAEIIAGKIAIASENINEIAESLVKQGVPVDVANSVAPKFTISNLKTVVAAKVKQ